MFSHQFKAAGSILTEIVRIFFKVIGRGEEAVGVQREAPQRRFQSNHTATGGALGTLTRKGHWYEVRSCGGVTLFQLLEGREEPLDEARRV